MKKLAVIAAMALSLATMTACGNKADDTSNVENQKQENQNTENNEENLDDNTDSDDTEDGSDTDADDKDADDTDTDDKDTDDTDTDDKDADDTDTDDTDADDKDGDGELLEAGEEPDFKLNDAGCFNGTYEGDDGCIYKFTKKGKLIITSDSETLKYEYTLNDDVLSMISEDGSFGTSRQITLLEDGTYLLDDAMGNQVILTYME